MLATLNLLGPTAILRLSGRFDLTARLRFNHVCEEVWIRRELRELHVDLAGVEYMDSSALGMLLILQRRAAERALPVTLLHCQPHVRRILGSANFTRLFCIAPN